MSSDFGFAQSSWKASKWLPFLLLFCVFFTSESRMSY